MKAHRKRDPGEEVFKVADTVYDKNGQIVLTVKLCSGVTVKLYTGENRIGELRYEVE